MVPWSEYMI